ncbi:hypothetical protein LMG28138_03224 [Pararobbsia alpina]|uniref:Uncharacterized protein n=1 Tax=Pararobbsia alpina TaxID=621374 RepID=A0A6S7CK89_9BURK|nr:hypothetical protein LMG28138_03224 [Pararobbsia alpina]
MKRVRLEPPLSYQSNDAYAVLYRVMRPPKRNDR